MNTFMVKYYTYKTLRPQTGSSRDGEISRWASHYPVSIYVLVCVCVFKCFYCPTVPIRIGTDGEAALTSGLQVFTQTPPSSTDTIWISRWRISKED